MKRTVVTLYEETTSSPDPVLDERRYIKIKLLPEKYWNVTLVDPKTLPSTFRPVRTIDTINAAIEASKQKVRDPKHSSTTMSTMISMIPISEISAFRMMEPSFPYEKQQQPPSSSFPNMIFKTSPPKWRATVNWLDSTGGIKNSNFLECDLYAPPFDRMDWLSISSTFSDWDSWDKWFDAWRCCGINPQLWEEHILQCQNPCELNAAFVRFARSDDDSDHSEYPIVLYLPTGHSAIDGKLKHSWVLPCTLFGCIYHENPLAAIHGIRFGARNMQRPEDWVTQAKLLNPTLRYIVPDRTISFKRQRKEIVPMIPEPSMSITGDLAAKIISAKMDQFSPLSIITDFPTIHLISHWAYIRLLYSGCDECALRCGNFFVSDEEEKTFKSSVAMSVETDHFGEMRFGLCSDIRLEDWIMTISLNDTIPWPYDLEILISQKKNGFLLFSIQDPSVARCFSHYVKEFSKK